MTRWDGWMESCQRRLSCQLGAKLAKLLAILMATSDSLRKRTGRERGGDISFHCLSIIHCRANLSAAGGTQWGAGTPPILTGEFVPRDMVSWSPAGSLAIECLPENCNRLKNWVERWQQFCQSKIPSCKQFPPLDLIWHLGTPLRCHCSFHLFFTCCTANSISLIGVGN